MVGPLVVGALKPPCVFGCFLGWELGSCAVPTSDSMLVSLVEVFVSLVGSPSSSTTRGLSEVCQRGSWVVARNARSALTLAATNLTGST